MTRDGFLLPLVLFLLRALTPVGRVDALLKLNRLVDLDLEGEVEKAGGPPTAGFFALSRQIQVHQPVQLQQDIHTPYRCQGAKEEEGQGQ